MRTGRLGKLSCALGMPGAARTISHATMITPMRKSFMALPCSHRRNLEEFAVVTGLAWNTKLTAAVQFCHDRHHRHDRLAAGTLNGGLNIGLLAELDQIARGRKRQLEPPAFAPRQRLARRHPD